MEGGEPAEGGAPEAATTVATGPEDIAPLAERAKFDLNLLRTRPLL